MKTSLLALVALLPLGICSAGNSSQPLGVEPALDPAATVERQADLAVADTAGDQLLAQVVSADDDQPGDQGKAKGKGKGKARGKAKGHNKDNESDNEDQGGNQPAAQPSAAAPSGTAVAPTDSPRTPQKAAVAPKLSQAEVKAQLDQHLNRITALDKKTTTSATRFAEISKETGVPVSTLQAQHKAHPVGSGGLLLANDMAKATGKPAATFLKERLAGRGWVRIAEEHKFDLTPELPKLSRLQSSMEAVPQATKR